MTLKLADNVTVLPVVSKLDLPAERVLAAAQEMELASCVIIGKTADGKFYFASSLADGGDVLWLMEVAKLALMGQR